MDRLNRKITLQGPTGAFFEKVEMKLSAYLAKFKLSFKIESILSSGVIQLTYRDSVLYFEKDSIEEDFKSLFDFLSNINPKTGKVCKCSDCKNCPSKKLDL